MIPITRIDEYLAVISQDEDATGLPDQAVTRIDTYLSKIAGEAVAELPEPVTRIDRYLASIAGMDVVMYDPITRIDYYLATVAGVYSGELPEPVTRIDYYLYQWAQGGGLPWQTFSGNPLQFTAPKAHTLKSATVEFSPKQDLHGYDSPWPAGGGANKMPPPSSISAPTGITAVNKDGIITLNGTTEGGTLTADISPVTFASAGQKIAVMNSFTSAVIRFYYQGSQVDYFSLGTTNRVINEADMSALQGKTIDQYRIQINAQTLTNATIGLMLLGSSDSASPFSPYSNICPISGWTGLDINGAGENLVYTSLGNRNIDSTGKIVTRSGYALKIAQVKKGAIYVISTDDDGGAVYAFYTSEPQTDSVSYNGARVVSVDNFVFEAPIDGFVAFRSSSGYQYAMLNLGSTASPYAPYTGSTTTITFPTTVYGGTLDVTTGVLTATWKGVDMGSVDWSYQGTNTCFYVVLPDKKDGNCELICSIAKHENNKTYAVEDYCIGTSEAASVLKRIFTSFPEYTTVPAFQTAMTGQTICYELAEPVTYQLTPTQIDALLGINTMWTDGDSLTVEARGEVVNLNALQSLNMLLGGRYVNNHTADDLTDEEALDIILNGGNR